MHNKSDNSPNAITQDKKFKAVGYVRVSTDKQADTGCSLEMQIEKVRAHAALHDYELVDVLVDDGYSAKNMNRPAIQSAIETLRNKTAQTLVIYRLDRLTRNVDDIRALIDEFFRSDDYSLVSITDSIDTKTPFGRMLITIISVFSETERELIGERTKSCLQHKKANNETYCKRLYGYNNVDGKLVPNENERRAVKLIVEHRDRFNYSFNQIAGYLNDIILQYPPPSGLKWYHHTVKAIYEREKQK